MEELVNILKEKGLGRNGLMIRSCYNDEDLPNFSNAGVYDSMSIDSVISVRRIYDRIVVCILPSKYKKSGRSIRKYYSIPDEDVKPGVVLQDKVD